MWLKTFLQRNVTLPGVEDDPKAEYVAAFVDLRGHGTRQAIVYLQDRWACGSSGCPIFVFSRKGSSYRLVTESFGHLPVRILNKTSHGWRSIAVWVEGGGILPGYEAELDFDGSTYPGNPTMPPARRLVPQDAGKVVISPSQAGTPLYP